MGRRGAIELQFNWIFILVAGVLILSLVVGFSLGWIKISGKTSTLSSLGNLKTRITATGVVEGESKFMEIPNLDLKYDCSQFKSSGVSGPGLATNLLFAPPELKGTGLQVWTYSWFVPFYAGNFIFATTPEAKYNVIYDNSGPSQSLMNTLKKFLPAKVNVQYASDAAAVPDENNYYTVFVFLNLPLANPGFSGKRLKAVEVTLNADNISGSVKFYKQNGVAWEQVGDGNWLKKEQLMGALVSGDYNIYSCVFNSSMTAVEVVSGVLLEKVKLLKDSYQSNPKYSNLYTNVEGEIQQMNTLAASHSLAISQIVGFIRRLNEANKILVYESVPQVY